MHYTNGTVVKFSSVGNHSPTDIQFEIQTLINLNIATAKSEFQRQFTYSQYIFKTDAVSTMIDSYSSTLYVTLVYTITYNN
jgi:hypothetical protein